VTSERPPVERLQGDRLQGERRQDGHQGDERPAGEHDDAAEEFHRHRPRLIGIAYRLLGSMWDAEDVVADAYLRWMRTDRSQIREPVAFLTTVVSRLALDQLRSARATREAYVGPWLPEPALTDGAPFGPLDTVEQRESISLATLHVLERLTPPERAVFVLREAFDVPYARVAELLDVTPEGARQLLRRARARVGDGRVRFASDAQAHRRLLDSFLHVLTSGELDGLSDLLATDAIAYSDGGGKANAAVRPVAGSGRIESFLATLLRRVTVEDVRIVEANGLPAALLRIGGQDELLTIDVQEGRIQRVYGILNPDKLRYAFAQLADTE
jgi:RNA polymerase sigma-70 factor, ECF subfamily